jgi:hypothetical protein
LVLTFVGTVVPGIFSEPVGFRFRLVVLRDDSIELDDDATDGDELLKSV